MPETPQKENNLPAESGGEESSNSEGQNNVKISPDVERARRAELEIIERKARAMIALGHEILDRVQELKAA